MLERQSNSRKRVQRAGKRVRNTPAPTVRSPTKTPTNSHNLYTEDLAHIHAELAYSIPCELMRALLS